MPRVIKISSYLLCIFVGFGIFFLIYYFLGPVKEIKVYEKDEMQKCESLGGEYNFLSMDLGDWQRKYKVSCSIPEKTLFKYYISEKGEITNY